MIEVEDDLPRIDRSTLERYATCPLQARLCAETVRSAGPEAASGSQIHAAFSRMIALYIEERGVMGEREIVDRTLQELYAARPDVQPDAIAGARRSLWEFAKLIGEQKWWKNPETGKVHCTILRFDGGPGNYSGQLSYEHGGVVVTGEVDLLIQGRATEEVTLIDYKTGHKYWTADDVGEAFQFQLYAALVMENYPEVQRVWVSIWNTRTNSRTYRIAFTREYDLPAIRVRINSAIGEWYQNHAKPIDKVPAWPVRSKCSVCPALVACRAADGDIKEMTTPELMLSRLQLLSEQSKAVTKLLSDRVAATGQDIVAGGMAFGFGKPPAARKPKAVLYAVGGGDEDE